MKEDSKFELMRKDLLNRISTVDDVAKLDNAFEKDFFVLIQFCSLTLIDGDDNYFGNFLLMVERRIKYDLKTATAIQFALSNFIIYFNPYIILQCSLKEILALIKHDIYHILSNHIIRERKLRNVYSKLAINLALDISINGYIRNLPLWAETVSKVELSYNIDLPDEAPIEEYARLIQIALDKKEKSKKTGEEDAIVKEHLIEGAHDIWELSDGSNESQLNEMTKVIATKAGKNKIPSSVEDLLFQLQKTPQIPWSSYLKRYIKTISSGKKKVSTRRNRRQPDRLDLKGELKNYKPKLIVALDISGSISEEEIKIAISEVFSISKAIGTEITIIECDSEIRRVYNAKSPKEIKAKLETKGGTKFSPVVDFMNKKNMKNSLLIYFTDGCGEKELSKVPRGYNILWVLSGKNEELSLTKPYGIVKRLKEIKIDEKEDIFYMKNEFKDNVWMWAASAVL